MRSHYFTAYGKDKKGTLGDLPKPSPKPDEILVRMAAASVNPIDFKIRDGKLRFIRKENFPLILGGDGAGTVVQVGSKVQRFKVNDEVYLRVPKGGQGTFAEFVSIPESCASKKPNSLTLTQSAALPLVSLTSMQALFDVGQLKPGQKVFIPAGSGGVGSHAIQIAKARGTYVATTTSTKNLERVRSLGADLVIDYTNTDFRTQLKDFDVVFDTMGGEEQKRAFEILKPGGTLVSIVGPPTGQTGKDLGLGWKRVILSFVGFPAHLRAKRAHARYHFLFMKPSGAQLEELARLVDEGKVKPIIDRTFPLEKADEALAYVASGRARGKVIIEI